jgi:hypothetical protein
MRIALTDDCQPPRCASGVRPCVPLATIPDALRQAVRERCRSEARVMRCSQTTFEERAMVDWPVHWPSDTQVLADAYVPIVRSTIGTTSGRHRDDIRMTRLPPSCVVALCASLTRSVTSLIRHISRREGAPETQLARTFQGHTSTKNDVARCRRLVALSLAWIQLVCRRFSVGVPTQRQSSSAAGAKRTIKSTIKSMLKT